MKQRQVHNSDGQLVGLKKVISKNIFLAVASSNMSNENDDKTNSTWIKPLVKLPGRCWTELVLAL